LQALQTILAADQAQDVLQQLQPYLQRAETALDLDENGHSSFLRPDQPYAVEAAAYFQTVTRGSRRETIALLNQFVQAAIPVKDMYLFIFQPVQREVGRLWQLNRIGIPQEHFATHLTRMAMAQLAPMVVSSNRNGYSLLAASVGRELHDLGLRMVADFFEMDGWECYYLGANSPLEAIVQGVQAQQPQLLALSATISTQLNQVAEIIRQVRLEAGPGLKILVGGYPFNVAPAAWQRVGADGYAADADSAVREGYRLVS
jgi:methanogenic corrinoid protein MtbC1